MTENGPWVGGRLLGPREFTNLREQVITGTGEGVEFEVSRDVAGLTLWVGMSIDGKPRRYVAYAIRAQELVYDAETIIRAALKPPKKEGE